ncbi:hypothetical protein BDY19DRAFT_988086 [Irpex rosettiformis]|uniref:Uncharacterized protein n=1 Tax=Irpex rosettiformis TaxID=378272 RepID=A0ACB8UJD7_9APHY|nr:hypothetical protein BDY19DRAFT_988086 [Irpex rosettiformis]
MSSNVAHPSLSAWARQRITELFQATNPDQFETAFNKFMSDNVASIVVNGKNLSRDQWKHQLQDMRVMEQSATVKFLGSVETVNISEELSGEVGIFCEVNIDKRASVIGIPKAALVTMIMPDRSLHIPPGASTNLDFRRVFDMTCVYTEKELV